MAFGGSITVETPLLHTEKTSMQLPTPVVPWGHVSRLYLQRGDYVPTGTLHVRGGGGLGTAPDADLHGALEQDLSLIHI